MAPFEEKVLAYLDGSLPAAEREEVMRAVSISPDRRALLDAHLRMNDLFTIVQKPISAPLSLQRDLAKSVPVLAAKLPYLATDTRRRSAAAFGFFGRMASGLGSSRASTIGAVLLAIGLVSGGVWLVNQSQKNNSGSANARSSNGAPSVGASSSSAGGSSSAGSGFSGNDGAANNAPQGGSFASAGIGGSGSHGAVVGDTVSGAMRHHIHEHPSDRTDGSYGTHLASVNAGHSSHSNQQPINLSSPKALASTNHPQHNSTPVKTASNDIAAQSSNNAALKSESVRETNSLKDIAAINGNNAGQQNKSIASEPPAAIPAKPQEENPPADISIVTSLRPSSSLIPSRINEIQYSLQEDDKSYVPMRVFAVPTYRRISPNAPALSRYVVNNGLGVTNGLGTSRGFEVGVDYEISPWFSAGARVGQTAFLQIQPFPRFEKVPGYEHLNQQIADATITSVQAPWAGVALSYQFNPQSDTWLFGATLAGGESFWSGSTAPIAMLETNCDYKLSNAFALRGALSLDVSWAPKSAALTTNSNSTVGILQQGPDLASLRSTAIGLSFGLVFHP